MISGTQTLASIDRSIHEQRNKIAQVEDQAQDFAASLVELQRADAADYRELAGLRVGLLGEGELVDGLDAADRRVVAVLGQREQAVVDLNERLQANSEAQAALDEKRGEQADKVDQAAGIVDQAEAETQQRLDADPDYQAQRERAHAETDTAAHADEKASQSEQELEKKGAAYRGDSLFMYLWRRNYGLPAYRAGSLSRWLDGKVARLIGFADARANFSRLNEIPQRLREHADGLQQAAARQFEALKQLDTAAREQDGIPALEQELDRQQQALDSIDSDIAAAEAGQQKLLNDKAAFAAGEDPHSRKAVAFLAAEFQREDLAALRDEAMRTPLPDDDLLVSRLQQRDDARRRLHTTAQGIRGSLEQYRARLRELEGLRKEFKRHRFDRPGSTFRDGAMITMMLGNFLSGALDRHALWRLLQQQQHYQPRRANPRFGSGGFGRGSMWGRGGGLGDLGGVLGGISRGGSRGGGFGGGSSGGGGFRTGGGF